MTKFNLADELNEMAEDNPLSVFDKDMPKDQIFEAIRPILEGLVGEAELTQESCLVRIDKHFELSKEASKALRKDFKGLCKGQKAPPLDERKTRQASFFIKDKLLLEQMYRDGKSLFLTFDTTTGEPKTIPYVQIEEETIEPINGEDIELGAVKLPTGINKYGTTLSLLAEIETHIYKYLDVSSSYLKFAAYYILLSWLYDRFNTLPYLRALGDTGCGKSRFLDVIGGLCYKAISASGCVTPAPIYRMLRKWGGTLILDEADMKNSDEYNEVVTILNCGFERGRPVIRATKDNPDRIQILPVYGPKVFATRRRFKDVALEARCLTEIMGETDREDIPPVLGRKFFEEQQELRNKLLLFRLRSYFQIEAEAAATLNLTGIEPRLRQVSEAFMSLFADEPAALESYECFIREHQKELIEQRAATKVGQVVEAMFELLEVTLVTMVTAVTGDSVINITSGQIAEKISITPQAVGQILKSLGLETRSVKTDGKTKRLIIYDEAKFNKLKRRYIPEEEPSVSTVTHVTNVTNVTGAGCNFYQTTGECRAAYEIELMTKPPKAGLEGIGCRGFQTSGRCPAADGIEELMTEDALSISLNEEQQDLWP